MGKEDSQARTLERVRKELASGETFSLVAASHRSRYGYQPPTSRWQLSHFLTVIGHMSAESDAMLMLASHVLSQGFSLALTPGQNCARAYDAAFMVLSEGFFDSVRAGSPDPGRRSDLQREFTIGERVRLLAWLSEACARMDTCASGVGWCVEIIAKELGVSTKVSQAYGQ